MAGSHRSRIVDRIAEVAGLEMPFCFGKRIEICREAFQAP
jgi:hypothetical protein